jgi:hypothetical protein
MFGINAAVAVQLAGYFTRRRCCPGRRCCVCCRCCFGRCCCVCCRCCECSVVAEVLGVVAVVLGVIAEVFGTVAFVLGAAVGVLPFYTLVPTKNQNLLIFMAFYVQIFKLPKNYFPFPQTWVYT